MGVFDNLRQRRQERRAYNESDAAALEPYRENAFTVGSVFGAAGRQRAAAKQQEVLSRYLNEEIAAQVGDSTSADMTVVIPQAYFSAARRIAALGSATEAQQLYQAGLQALEATTKHAVTLDHMRAQTGDLNEAQGEYLETTRQRDALLVQAAQFPEGTPTGDALRKRIAELETRMTALNERGVNVGAPPREIVLGAQFEADRAANNGQPGAAERVWSRERQSSSRAQDYANYVEQERAAGRTPVEYDKWTPPFQGQISASQTLGGEGIKSLFDLEGQAQAAKANLRTVQNSVNILNEGIRMGPGVDARQYIARGIAEFFGDDPSQVTVNTDVYLASAGQRVLNEARKLAPVTELDLTRIEQIVAAGLTTTPEATREALKLISEAQTNIVNRYNRRLASLGDHYLDVADTFEPIDVPTINFGETVLRFDAQGNRIQ